MRDTEAVKIAKLQLTRDLISDSMDLLKTPPGMMIGATIATNLLEKTPLMTHDQANLIRGVAVASGILGVAAQATKVVQPWVLPAAGTAGAAAAVSSKVRTAALKPVKWTRAAGAAAAGQSVTLLPPPPSGEYIAELKQDKKSGKTFLKTLNPVNLFK